MDYEDKTNVAMLLIEGPTRFVLACRCCEGTGRLLAAFHEEWLDGHDSGIFMSSGDCEVCHGAGALRVESPDIPFDHGGCQGTGRTRECIIPPSKATADIPVSHHLSVCEGCGGLGIVSLSGKIAIIRDKPA